MECINLKLNPDRYGELEHPGDDVVRHVHPGGPGGFSRGGDQPLGGLASSGCWPRANHSRRPPGHLHRCHRPLERVFDGYFVHGRPGVGVALDGVFIPASAATGHGGERWPFRRGASASATTHECRSWTPERDGRDRARAEDWPGSPTPNACGCGRWPAPPTRTPTRSVPAGTTTGHWPRAHGRTAPADGDLMIGQTDGPINAGPQQHYVAQAAFARLVQWAAEGAAGCAIPRAQSRQDGLSPRRTRHRRGGVRTPWVDVPAAVMSGLGQSGEAFAFLFGRTGPFDEAALSKLYPGGEDEYSRLRSRPPRPLQPASSWRRTVSRSWR